MKEAETAPIDVLMVIDDDSVDQIMYRRIIERSNKVSTLLPFQYASDALDYLEEHDGKGVDAILLDINMPRMNGFEFLEEATKRFGEEFSVIVVMLTSSLSPLDAERAATYSIVREYLAKPLTIEHLERVIELVSGR